MSSILDNKQRMADIVKELWKDKTGSELASLQKNPKDYLTKRGVTLPSNNDVQVILEGKGKLHLYLPVGPDDVDTIPDADLKVQAARSLSASKEMF